MKADIFYCSECDEIVDESDEICQHCGADITEVAEESSWINFSNFLPQKFSMLFIYGKIFSTIGWLEIIVGIFLAVYIPTQTHYVFIENVLSYILILIGIPMVALGQYFECQVEIARNSIATVELLQKIEKNTNSSSFNG
ncbi:MAG: hypothetical protein K9I36_16855 [Bacteroidia bacterium]|nr:hypothetical protein [Bacteroidia bacterium]